MRKLILLFSSTTIVGRIIRTFVQSLVGILVFCIAVFNQPLTGNIFLTSPLAACLWLAGFVTAVTALHNIIEALLKWVFEDY